MALVVADRVQETTITTGTGTVTLAGASAGYQSFAVIGNGNTTYYTLTSGNNWEVGIGTYTSSGTTLARTTVLASSAGGTTKITLSGTSNVFVTYPAEIATMLTNPTPTNGGVVYGTGTAIGVSAVGTVSGYQFLQSAGAASPTWVQIPSFKDVAVAPSSPAPIEGDRFFDNTSGINYTYITDANGSQWVETSAAGTPTNGVFSTMALGGATLGSNALAVTGTTALSGLLTAAGGVSSTLTTDATSSTTGSIITAGGISCQKALWVGTTATIAGALTTSQTAGIVGTTTNNDANAGSVGEYIQSTLASGSAISLTINTGTTIVSISLTAGDWDVTGAGWFTGGSSTVISYLLVSISTVNNTLQGQGTTAQQRLTSTANLQTPGSVQDINLICGATRISLSATTTIYLVTQVGFSTSTLTAYGQIRARRIR